MKTTKGKFLSYLRGLFVKRSRLEPKALLDSDCLDIDQLCKQYGMSLEKIGRFLEMEIGWPYLSHIVLSPRDFALDLSSIDQLNKFSALMINSNTKGRRRFITSNPDLIMESNKEFKTFRNAGVEFQLASMELLKKTLTRIKLAKAALESVPEIHKASFGVFILSFIDCLELGASEIEYGKKKYVAKNQSESYEGVLSPDVVGSAKSVLLEIGIKPLESLSQEFIQHEPLCFFENQDGFVLKFGSKVEKLQGQPAVERNFKHILLVDDDQSFVDLLKRGISLKGFRVSVASSAKQAIEYLNSSGVKIDLVISDFHMPNYSGASLIASIREVDLELPIIGLTGDSHSESYVSFITAGANAIVRKSDDPKVLFAWIYKLLSEERQLRVA